jgi:hypothetical protein
LTGRVISTPSAGPPGGAELVGCAVADIRGEPWWGAGLLVPLLGRAVVVCRATSGVASGAGIVAQPDTPARSVLAAMVNASVDGLSMMLILPGEEAAAGLRRSA